MKLLTKTTFFAFATFIVILSFAACGKKNDPTMTFVADTFTLRGNTYTVAQSADSSVSSSTGSTTVYVNEFEAAGFSSDKKKTCAVGFFFNGTTKPAAGSYKVIATSLFSVDAIPAGQVAVLALDSASIALEGIFTPAATANVSLTVSVSSSGKLTINLPSVAMTGSNLDNTNSSNTVVTTVNTTMSGSFTEQ